MNCDPGEIRATQDYFGFQRPAPIEKDWHVIQALRAIMAIEPGAFRLIFAGGTALARAHRLIRRMSEDVDLKIVPVGSARASRNQLRQQLGALRASVTAAIQQAGFSFDPAQQRSRDQNHYMVYHLPFGDESHTEHGLRPSIQIELTYTTLRRPSVALPVRSFVAEAFGRAYELSAIDCVSVTETAAEKLVGLTRRIAAELAGVSRTPDPTLVRHIYDLHLVRDHVVPYQVAGLAREIAFNDAAEFRNQYPAYAADINGETRKALAAIESDPV